MKTIITVAIVLCLWLRIASGEIGSTHNPQFAWNHSPDFTNTGARYELHYGKAARTTDDPFDNRSYTATSSVPRFFTSFHLTNMMPGVWFVSAILVSSNGIPTDYSNEICYTNRGQAPMSLRLVYLGPNPILQGTADAVNWSDLAELTNPPVRLSIQQRQLFRLRMSTNLPPLPGGVP